MKIIKYLSFLIVFLTLAGTAYGLAIPGPHKALCPSCYGLEEIAPNVFTEKQSDEGEIREIVERSRATTEKFFGENLSNPRMILCSTDECNAIFTNSITRGQAYGSRLVRVSPLGLNETIITHELVHTEVFKRVEKLGVFATLGGAIPAWFNEGLAVLLSEDVRFQNKAEIKHMKWALTFKTYSDWGDSVNRDNWRAAYGGSKDLVAHLEKQMGRDGLLKLIDDVTENEADFYELTHEHLAFLAN